MLVTENAGRFRRAGMLATLLAAGGAGAITIAPVVVELSPARKVVSVTVTNPSDSAVNFQAEVLEWSQANGQDKLEATHDIMVVPPIVRIAAGATQIFRVTSRRPPGAREQAYRLILEDVTAEAVASQDSATVNIRVRHSLPVFVATAGTPLVSVQVAQCAAPVGKACVRLTNDGGRYVTTKSMSIEGGSWNKQVVLGTRLLAGGWREWQFDLPAKVPESLSVTADTSAGTFSGALSTLSR
jgi:fimbrial chaperone protein